MTPMVQAMKCEAEGCEKLANPHVGTGRHCVKCFEEISSLNQLWDFERHRRPEPVRKLAKLSLSDMVLGAAVMGCAWWIVGKFTLWMAAQYFLEWGR